MITEIKGKVYLHFPLEEQRTISSGYNIKEVILISRFIDPTSKYRAEFPFFIIYKIDCIIDIVNSKEAT